MRRLLLAWALVLLALRASSAGFHLLDGELAGRLMSAGPARVVVLWTLDCVYCRHDLDLLAQLRRRSPNLRVVTVLAEEQENLAAAWQELERRGLTDQAWAFGDEDMRRLRHAIDPAWRGETPRLYVFGADGSRRTLIGRVSPEDLQPALAGARR